MTIIGYKYMWITDIFVLTAHRSHDNIPQHFASIENEDKGWIRGLPKLIGRRNVVIVLKLENEDIMNMMSSCFFKHLINGDCFVRTTFVLRVNTHDLGYPIQTILQ